MNSNFKKLVAQLHGLEIYTKEIRDEIIDNNYGLLEKDRQNDIFIDGHYYDLNDTLTTLEELVCAAEKLIAEDLQRYYDEDYHADMLYEQWKDSRYGNE